MLEALVIKGRPKSGGTGLRAVPGLHTDAVCAPTDRSWKSLPKLSDESL
jgi:hypothetical protein